MVQTHLARTSGWNWRVARYFGRVARHPDRPNRARALMRPHGDVQQQLGATLRPGDDQAVEHAGHAVGTPASARSQAVALRSTLGLVLDGSTVTIVVPGGPAWRAVQDGERIEVGDLVRSVDGQQITSRNAADALRGADLPGTPVRIEVEKRPSTASGKWTARDLSVYPAQQVKVTEFVVVRQDIEMVMLLKNVQSALGTVWKAVGDGGRVQKPLEDLERCFDSVVVYAADDEARLCQAVRELERKSGASAGRGLQDVDLAMLSQQAAHEVRQARQRIRTLEMQLAMVGNEIDGSREEERRARAAALEAQEAFRRNDADLRAEIENLQEGMVRLDRRVRDESARADEERERADRLIEEARILRSNTEAMQLELERHDVIKNKSAKQSSEAVALALREVLLVQDELSAAKNEIEQLRESEQLVNERLRVIEAARDTIDLGEGHRNEQLKTLRSEIVFLRKTIEAVKDERDQMREHIAKQAREIVLLDSRLSDKAAADNADLEATKAHLFKVQNALRLRETQVMALEEELRRRTQFNSQQAHAKTSGATTANKGATGGQRGVVPLFNARFDDVQYVLLAALFMALLLLILRSLQTLGESSVLQAVGGFCAWLWQKRQCFTADNCVATQSACLALL